MQIPNSSMVDPSSTPKRCTPPNQRNRTSNRRRSRVVFLAKVTVNGNKLDRPGSSHSNEGERSQPVTVGFQRENSSPRIIALKGSSRSEAYQLLSDRWAAAMHIYNDPTVDLSERPMMYYGGDVWGKQPHNVKPILASANNILPSPKLPMDYRTELFRGLADSKVAKF